MIEQTVDRLDHVNCKHNDMTPFISDPFYLAYRKTAAKAAGPSNFNVTLKFVPFRHAPFFLVHRRLPGRQWHCRILTSEELPAKIREEGAKARDSTGSSL